MFQHIQTLQSTVRFQSGTGIRMTPVDPDIMSHQYKDDIHLISVLLHVLIIPIFYFRGTLKKYSCPL